MPVRDVVASPVLVGRDEALASAHRRIEAAADGNGRLLLVSGEAGIGKSRLLASISRRAEQQQFAVVRAAAFPGDAEASGGLLLDLAGDLRRASDATSQEVGAAISTRLRQSLADDVDPRRRRRLLVQDLADTFAQLDTDLRLLVLLEDLHWADELSLAVHRPRRRPARRPATPWSSARTAPTSCSRTRRSGSGAAGCCPSGSPRRSGSRG